MLVVSPPRRPIWPEPILGWIALAAVALNAICIGAPVLEILPGADDPRYFLWTPWEGNALMFFVVSGPVAFLTALIGWARGDRSVAAIASVISGGSWTFLAIAALAEVLCRSRPERK